MSNDYCPFCMMFISRKDDIIDIEPLDPVVPGHRIVIPRDHVQDFAESPFITSEVMRYAARRAKQLGGDFNLITSKGPAATQSVFHLHVHLVPRREDDGLHLPWTGQKKAA